MIARTAVATSRREGVAAAVGMGAGGVLFAVAALLGLHALLHSVPMLYVVLKVLGGIYLAFLGVRIWVGAKRSLVVGNAGVRTAAREGRALALGFMTQVSNPKTAVVYASVFAAFLPGSQSLAFDVVLVAVVFLMETGWYALVATVLASERPRGIYLRCKVWMDRFAGVVMVTLGLKLVCSAGR